MRIEIKRPATCAGDLPVSLHTHVHPHSYFYPIPNLAAQQQGHLEQLPFPLLIVLSLFRCPPCLSYVHYDARELPCIQNYYSIQSITLYMAHLQGKWLSEVINMDANKHLFAVN